MKLLLVRHGETFFNNAGRIQGTMDPGLNERGREQVDELADHLPADREYDMVTSPLRRARETAESLREELTIRDFSVIEPFRELDQGHWNGLRSETVARLEPERFRTWEESPHETHPRGGESLDDVRDRVSKGLDQLATDHESPVIVVAHKVVNSMILHLAEDTDYGTVMDSMPENAAIYEIDDYSPGSVRSA